MNHISDYLATSHATQRTRVIRNAKFPKKVEVAAYGQIRKPLKAALTKDDFDRDGLEFLIGKMEAKALTETGYARDEALRCAKAARAFQETFNPKSFARYMLSSSTKTISKNVAGVKINVTLDAMVTETKGDATHAGGIALLYAFSDRTNVNERLAATSGLILWTLESRQMQPLPRLCMAVDLAGRSVVKASNSFERFRQRVSDSCSEIAARWGEIEPPDDYDGPHWR